MARRVGRPAMGFSPAMPPVLGIRAPWPVVLEAAADDAAAADVAGNASFTWLTGEWQAPSAHAAEARSRPQLELAKLVGCRRPVSRVGMGSFVSQQAVPTPQGFRSVWLESFNEQAHLMDLAVGCGIHGIMTQPFRIEWRFDRMVREHTPDFLLDDATGRRVLVDVTTRQKIAEPEVLAVFTLTAMTAAMAGWDYELRTELPMQRVRNLRFLWPALVESALGHDVWRGEPPCTVSEAACSPAGLPGVWRAIASRIVAIDLDVAWTPSTTLVSKTSRREHSWLVRL